MMKMPLCIYTTTFAGRSPDATALLVGDEVGDSVGAAKVGSLR